MFERNVGTNAWAEIVRYIIVCEVDTAEDAFLVAGGSTQDTDAPVNTSTG